MTHCLALIMSHLKMPNSEVHRLRFSKQKLCTVSRWIKIACETETWSHFLPRNIVIFISHILIDSVSSASVFRADK